jgi:hypothetical protein
MRTPSPLAAILAIVLAWMGLYPFRAYAQDTGLSERLEMDSRASDSYAQADRRGLKQSLRLSAEQEKLWAPVDDALTKLIEQRQASHSAQMSQEPTDQIERLRRRAELISQRAEALKKLADAVQPLWVSLSDEQKRDFARVLPRPLQQAYQSSRSDRREADEFRSSRHSRGDRHHEDAERFRDRDEYGGGRHHRDRMMSRRGGDELDDNRDDRDRFDRYSRRRAHDDYSPRSRRYDRDYDRRSDRDYCRCYRDD